MRSISITLVLSAFVAAAALFGCADKKQEDKTLRLYAGAGLSRAVDELAAEFEKVTGVKVEPDYGGSGMIITRAKLDQRADLFMPGDVWYVNQLQADTDLIEEKDKKLVAFFVPVIIVPKGGAKGIKSLEDLFRPDVKVALGNPRACQVGRLTTKIFEKNGLDRSKLTAKESVTVNDLGVWVKMGDVDAAIVWDAIAANFAKWVRVIEIPRDRNMISRVVIAMMTTSTHKAEARQFIEFVASPRGQEILARKGYCTREP